MNKNSIFLFLSIFAFVSSAQANEELWDAVFGKNRDRAIWLLKNDRTADTGHIKNGKTVLQLIEETEQWDLLDFVGDAARQDDAVRTTFQFDNGPRRPVVAADLGSLIGGLMLGGGNIHETVGHDERGVPFREIRGETAQDAPQRAPRPAAPQIDAFAALGWKRSMFPGISAPKSQMVPKKFPHTLTCSFTNVAPDARVVEELVLTTGTVIRVLEGDCAYRIVFANAQRMEEIDELVRALPTPEELKEQLRSKGLLH
jgi:hypothetical protein